MKWDCLVMDTSAHSELISIGCYVKPPPQLLLLIHVNEVNILCFNDRKVKNVTCRSLVCVLLAWVRLVARIVGSWR